jgi:hypothetical protein
MVVDIILRILTETALKGNYRLFTYKYAGVGKICTFNKRRSTMNARSYRVNISSSPLDFRVDGGLIDSSVSCQSEPHINKQNLALTITKMYVLTDMNTNRKHGVLAVKSDYEIPINLLRSREDVYEFYKDALLGLNETYQLHRTISPTLFNITFPNQPIESYKGEIDRVFGLLDSQN